VQEGEHLTVTAVAQQAKVAVFLTAFALWCSGGNQVMTWGNPLAASGCLSVQDRLSSVQKVQATGCAFAALLADGSVVAWGDLNYGGDCSTVQDQLKNVQQIEATGSAFAAILADGSVVWGHPSRVGDSSKVPDRPRNVQKVQAADCAFSAILADGSLITWGYTCHPFIGGNWSALQD